MSEGNDQSDLHPLTLRQKVENKRFNKTLDRILGVWNALALGILGYGVVKEGLDAIADRAAFDPVLLLVSLIVGVGIEVGIAYVTFKLSKRED